MGFLGGFRKLLSPFSDTLEGLQNHEKAGDHSVKDSSQEEPATATDEQCPLCIKSVPTLRQHLLEVFNF